AKTLIRRGRTRFETVIAGLQWDRSPDGGPSGPLLANRPAKCLEENPRQSIRSQPPRLTSNRVAALSQVSAIVLYSRIYRQSQTWITGISPDHPRRTLVVNASRITACRRTKT